MKKAILFVVVALWASGLMAARAALAADKPQTVKMKIDGMTCGMCEMKVRESLASLCTKLDISAKTGEGLCVYNAPVTADQVVGTVNKAGYKATKAN